jgi:hypothetical protein
VPTPSTEADKIKVYRDPNNVKYCVDGSPDPLNDTVAPDVIRWTLGKSRSYWTVMLISFVICVVYVGLEVESVLLKNNFEILAGI